MALRNSMENIHQAKQNKKYTVHAMRLKYLSLSFC